MYKLADGTNSTDYKIGDRFEVVEAGNSSMFSVGSILEYQSDDRTSAPEFKLISGQNTCDSDDWGFQSWGKLKSIPNSKMQVDQNINEAITTLQSLIAWPEITLEVSEDDVVICVWGRKFATAGEDVEAVLETVNMLVGQELPQ